MSFVEGVDMTRGKRKRGKCEVKGEKTKDAGEIDS
jgi:hypothetical protein